jgi:hypothetical protein
MLCPFAFLYSWTLKQTFLPHAFAVRASLGPSATVIILSQMSAVDSRHFLNTHLKCSFSFTPRCVMCCLHFRFANQIVYTRATVFR